MFDRAEVCKKIFVAIKCLHTRLFHSLLQNGAVTYEVSKSLCNVPELKNYRLALTVHVKM